MLNTANPSELMKLQPTILRFTQMLSAVLQLDAEVVDADLVRIAGTGPYSKSFGKKINASSRIFRYIIESHQEKIVMKSRTDPLCKDCSSIDNCRETAFLGVPIMVEDRCIGVLSLVAFSIESRERIKDNVQLFSDYIRHISRIFVSKVLEFKESEPKGELDVVFTSLIENMDQGVLVLDENNRVMYGNQPALSKLHIGKSELLSVQVNIQPLSHHNNELKGHQQHIISFGNMQELVVGQFHNINSHKLFLMAFYQPNASIIASHNEPDQFSSIIGESTQIKKLKSLINRVSKSPSSILIRGESGTGKEVFAKAVHDLSNRNKAPFVALNCAAIPEQLLESELFGYMKGAFTGASSKGKTGLIQAANGGTLFLDEIGDMSMTLQAKLLRVLEEREVMPIGASKAIPIDIRVISATNQNFEEMILTNQFREDLFYRLNVIPLHLPALKDREGDVALLVSFFLDMHTRKIGVSYPGITANALNCLENYQWPGNVRELSNLIEYLVNIVPDGDQIDVDLLPPYLEIAMQKTSETSSGTAASPVSQLHFDDNNISLEEMEKIRIEEAITRLDSRKQVADELGIGIATLYRKLKKYELS
ncbi:sigma 54-interacting transcriptional regulator [Aliivibrio kagoshimensis]|uniref:sigma 54-interacting transcriptional regulator n=1 Tax=Aliivibrio kagoshimensis TaxID=2910230 RepID=UPI003D09C52E